MRFVRSKTCALPIKYLIIFLVGNTAFRFFNFYVNIYDLEML